jgi:hypothetical protein
LVTKPKFYAKPTKEDYDCAFHKLTQDFMHRGLKRLICSPMGCCRDGISVGHFADNLMKFQRCTKASIVVVTFGEKDFKQNLYRGQSYSDFVGGLNAAFSHYENKSTVVPAHQPNVPDDQMLMLSTEAFPPLPTTSRSTAIGTYSPASSETLQENTSKAVTGDELQSVGASNSVDVNFNVKRALPLNSWGGLPQLPV